MGNQCGFYSFACTIIIMKLVYLHGTDFKCSDVNSDLRARKNYCTSLTGKSDHS